MYDSSPTVDSDTLFIIKLFIQIVINIYLVGNGFETYEPDEGTLPTIIDAQQRLRDTGSAFLNFATQVTKRFIQYFAIIIRSIRSYCTMFQYKRSIYISH